MPALTAAGNTTSLPYTVPENEVQLNSADRLLRYDATDADFVSLNKALWELCDLHEDDYDETLSLYDYLISKKLNPNMLKMAAAGFSNTLCSNSYELSLKQAVKWSRIWHAEGMHCALAFIIFRFLMGWMLHNIWSMMFTSTLLTSPILYQQTLHFLFRRGRRRRWRLYIWQLVQRVGRPFEERSAD